MQKEGRRADNPLFPHTNMSNSSGFSGFPPKIESLSDIPSSVAERKAKIIEIRGEMRVQKVREQMQAQVISNRADGSTRLETPRGEITVRFSGNQPPPSEGSVLTLEVPRGSPPSQVIIRAPAADPARPQNTQAGNQVTTPQSKQDTSQTARGERIASDTPAITTNKNITRPLSPEISRNLSTQTQESPDIRQTEPPAARTIKEGDILRLTPLSAEDAQRLANEIRAVGNAEQIVQTRATIAAATQTTLPRPEAVNIANTLNTNISSQTPTSTAALLQNTALAQPNLSAAPIIGGNATPATITTLSSAASSPNVSAPQSGTLVSRLFSPPAMTVAANALSPSIATDLIGLKTYSPALTNFLATSTTSGLPDMRVQSVQNSFVQLSAVGTPNVNNAQASSQNTLQTTPGALQAHIVHNNFIPQNMAQNITGNAGAHGSQGVPVVAIKMPSQSTPSLFAMAWPTTNLGEGSSLQMTPIIKPSGAVTQNTATGQGLPLAPFMPQSFYSSFAWPDANEALQSLNQATASAAQAMAQVLSQTTPHLSTPTRLPAAALLFVAAVRGGDISGWLGERGTEMLQRLGKGDLMSRLNRDLSGMQRSASDASSQEWRTLAMPLYSDQEIQKMMLHYRYDDSENGEQTERKGTRFIFDLSLDRLGPVQIDGLHRPMVDKKNRLDLIVRTTDPLGRQMQSAMRQLYLEALDQAGCIGELSFQGKQDGFIKIEMPKDSF